jgi:hypothetical protein
MCCLSARRIIVLLLLSMAALILTACDSVDSFDQAEARSASSEVDPLFREFYKKLNGEVTLGPPISDVSVQGGVSYQYTLGGLMSWNPNAPASQRFSLGPIGGDMEINEPGVANPGGEARYINGHVLGKEFYYLYEVMGGVRYVGRPLTEAHYNAERGRTEQFFENVGFYLNDGDPPEAARLMAYGAWMCSTFCEDRLVDYGPGVEPPERIHKRFLEAVERLGADFTGAAITEAYETPDGFIEQVFQNVVMISDVNKPRRVSLRPMTEQIGMSRETPVPALDDPNYFFFPTDGALGYNVPRLILDYLAQHGNMELSGPPITELTPDRENTYRQCFTNLCLLIIYDGGQARVMPDAQGYTYLDLGLPAGESASSEEPPAPQAERPEETRAAEQQPAPEANAEQGVTASVTPEGREISIQVWEAISPLPPDQGQEIGVSVYENGSPLSNVEPKLVVTLPDGSQRPYFMYPTDGNGQTVLQIDAIEAPIGTLVPYQVCLAGLGGEKICVRDSFLIWQNP